MSSPSSPSDPKTNVTTNDPTDQVSVDADIARFSSIISPEQSTDPEQELSESNLNELLEQLQKAEGVMDGVEDKLNSVMGQLDSLLETLEKKGEEEDTDEKSNQT
ncbi:hypothetical protein E1B28_001767 [Marasmius oreades]|uniref:Uncharacterized protein n=1 Tax=Marasmius oreades TaxID=181124 RepID=A0A9P8AFS8_9AGAR|nr:uncharacterized protein E1B28_001767 [Marasmius oreades]KAG7099974.1 hypothetical protein E1B28_001767 [Marasmius oreades]